MEVQQWRANEFVPCEELRWIRRDDVTKRSRAATVCVAPSNQDHVPVMDVMGPLFLEREESMESADPAGRSPGVILELL